MPDGCCVLIVDDDEGIRDALVVALTDEGYRVTCAGNGEVALAQLRSGKHPPPCLILLDLMMPVMDGLEFRARQLDDPDLARIPIAVMTAGTVPAAMARLPLVGKPLRFDKLTGMLRKCADHGRPSGT